MTGPSPLGRWLPALSRHAVKLVLTVVVTTFLVMAAVEISIPGGFRAVVIPLEAPGSERQQFLVDTYHLDDNLFERYGHWAGDVVRGDWGISTRGDNPVGGLITPRLPISLQLMLVSTAVTLLLGIPLGLWSAARDGSVGGTALNTGFGLSQSIPVFITPIILIWVFALQLRWLPAAGWVRLTKSPVDNLRHLALPAAALVAAEVGIVARIVRADVLRVMRTDFYTAAIGKGLTRRYVLLRHALRPASLGLLNVVGLNIGALLSGSMIIEIIFGLPGLGQVVLEATTDRDLHMLLALTTYFVVVTTTLNALVDLTMLALDPRLERGVQRAWRRQLAATTG
ncbi:MAG: ABC transporter permease [Actinomycetota bacterium]